MGTPARVVVLPKKLKEPLRIEELTLPDPDPTQVIVKQFASGICHSQLHQIHSPRRGPVILGHESSGVVLKIGKDVTGIDVGDNVLVTWVPRDMSYGAGSFTRPKIEVSEGKATMAEAVFTWADHTLADQQFVVKIDPDLRNDVTCIIGCAVMTGAGAVLNTADVQTGQSVAIFGVGGVGLSAVAGAKIIGADPIIAVDLYDQKLEFAKKFGATHGINAGKLDPVVEIHKLTPAKGGMTVTGLPVSGVDFAFDCIGTKKTMEQIVPACRRGKFGGPGGGTAILAGVPTTSVELDAFDFLVNEKSFKGSLAGSSVPDRDFGRFLDWYKRGDLDLDAMVTARYTMDQINEAVHALEHGEIAGRAILEF